MRGFKELWIKYIKVKPVFFRYFVFGFFIFSSLFLWWNDWFVNDISISFTDELVNFVTPLKKVKGNANTVIFCYLFFSIISFVFSHISPKLGNIFISMLGLLIFKNIYAWLASSTYSLNLANCLQFDKVLSIEQKMALFNAEIDKMSQYVDINIIDKINFSDIYPKIEFVNNPDKISAFCHDYIINKVTFFHKLYIDFGFDFIAFDLANLLIIGGLAVSTFTVISAGIYFYYSGSTAQAPTVNVNTILDDDPYDDPPSVYVHGYAGPVPAGLVPTAHQLPLNNLPVGNGNLNLPNPFVNLNIPIQQGMLDFYDYVMSLSVNVMFLFGNKFIFLYMMHSIFPFFYRTSFIIRGEFINPTNRVFIQNDISKVAVIDENDLAISVIFEIWFLFPLLFQIIIIIHLCFIIYKFGWLLYQIDFNIDKDIWLDR